MAKRYHINPDTGRPNQCTATVRGCKYSQGNLIPEHYDTKEEAQQAYEKQLEKQIVQSLKKQNKTIQDKGGKLKKKPSSRSAYAKKHGKIGDKINNNPVIYKKTPYEIGEDYYDQSSYKDYVSRDDYADLFVDQIDRGHDWNGTVEGIQSYSKYIDYDEGQYYYPSPDEDYHESDISYTTPPSFMINDKEGFAEGTLNSSHSTLKKIEIDEDFVNKLDEIGYYNENNYEPYITGNYYGDEFNGWKLDKSVQEKLSVAVTEQLVKQKLGK